MSLPALAHTGCYFTLYPGRLLGLCLQSGLPIACPLRCDSPQRVVANMAVRMLIDMHKMTLKRQREEQQRHSQQHRQPQQQQQPRPAKQGEQAPAHAEGPAPEAGSGAKLGDGQDRAAAGHAEGHALEDGTSPGAGEAATRPERQSAGTQTEPGADRGAGQAAQSAGTQTEGRPPGKEEVQGGDAQREAPEGQHSQQGTTGEPQMAAEDSLGQLSMAEIDGDGTAEGAMDGSEADELTEMNPICPLHDEHLPIDANSLKGKQVRLTDRVRLTGWLTWKLSLCIGSLPKGLALHVRSITCCDASRTSSSVAVIAGPCDCGGQGHVLHDVKSLSASRKASCAGRDEPTLNSADRGMQACTGCQASVE